MLSYAQRCAGTRGVSCLKPASFSRSSRAVHVRASADAKFDGYTPHVAAFFPGQGAQSVGMAKELVAEVPKAKEMFDKAKEILGYDLLQVRQQHTRATPGVGGLLPSAPGRSRHAMHPMPNAC